MIGSWLSPIQAISPGIKRNSSGIAMKTSAVRRLIRRKSPASAGMSISVSLRNNR
jgi:hypothetical protein